MKISKTFNGIITFALLAGFSACDSGGGGGGDNGSANLGSVVNAPTGPTPKWYSATGTACTTGPSPGCDWYYGTQTSLFQINIYSDPFYMAGEGEESSTWTSPDGITYMSGMAADSEETIHGKDTISNGAAARAASMADSALRLQAKYSLDADSAKRAVSAMSEWVELGKSRKRTAADVHAFVSRLSGLNMSEVSTAFDAIQKGDESTYNAALSKAARNWSTDPNTMKHILQDWLAQQVSAAEALKNH
jgi:hypothetical protein